MKRLLMLLAMLWPVASNATIASFDGWLVGEPCARELRIADCPLVHADRPVLLLEDGRTLAFLHGDKGVAWDQVSDVRDQKSLGGFPLAGLHARVGGRVCRSGPGGRHGGLPRGPEGAGLPPA